MLGDVREMVWQMVCESGRRLNKLGGTWLFVNGLCSWNLPVHHVPWAGIEDHSHLTTLKIRSVMSREPVCHMYLPVSQFENVPINLFRCSWPY